MMNYVAAAFQWLWAPMLAAGISFIYYQNSRNNRVAGRLLVSMHGASLASLYVVALLVHGLNASRPALGYVFWGAFAVPALLVIVSIARYKGNGVIHLLQLANLLAAAWVFFVGTMAVTGNWL
jgi:hypothetical protein